MINIVFTSVLPCKRKNLSGWWVHTGYMHQPFLQCETKRAASELLANMGRECTRILRELNDTYRRAVQEGQGLATTMTAPQIIEWNRLKGSFDQSFAFLAIRQSIIIPNAMTRLIGMARDLQGLCDLVAQLVKIRFTGAMTTMQCCCRDARETEKEIMAIWANVPTATPQQATTEFRTTNEGRAIA